MKLSIVTTMYCSGPYLEEFYKRIKKTIRKITSNYEIIFVNDGSPDDSFSRALSFYNKDSHVKIVDLSRNFGHHRAIMTGLSYAQGDYIFLIDCDLEEEPELLEKFWQKMKTLNDVDVIYGLQEKRKGGWFERFGGYWFYRLFSLLISFDIPTNMSTVRLMTKRYVQSVLSFPEKELILFGIMIITGFNQQPIKIQKYHQKRTVYSLRRKITLVVNAITSFSNKPLIYIFYLGVVISIVAFVGIGYLLIRKIFFGIFVGWTSLIVSVWLVGGLIIFSLGIIGIYLSRIFLEVKNRPVIVKNVYSRNKL